MSSHRTFLLAVLLAFLSGSALAASCSTCKGAGQVPIKRDRSYAQAAEQQAELGLWCNWCAALGLYDEGKSQATCPECQSLPAPASAPPAVQEALAPQLAAWWSGNDHSTVIFMTSPRFTLASELRDMPLKSSAKEFSRARKRIAGTAVGKGIGGGKTMGRHERAHLWMQRLHDGWAHCNALFGLADDAAAEELHQGDYRLHALLFTDGGRYSSFLSRQGSLIRRGGDATLPAYSGTSIGSDDLAWSRTLHTLGHHWVDRACGGGGGGPEDPSPGWLFHGLAFHLELHFYGAARFDYATSTEGNGPWGAAPRFGSAVYKDHKKGKADLERALRASVTGAGIDDKMVAWSLVDFLGTQTPEKLGALLRAMVAEKQPFAAALQSSHGWTEDELQASWSRHVARAYKKDRKTPPRRD